MALSTVLDCPVGAGLADDVLEQLFNAFCYHAYIGSLCVHWTRDHRDAQSNRVYYRYISEFYDDYNKIGELTEKFNNIITGKLKGKDASLSPVEHELYAVYSLTHLLKSFAKQQNLEIEQELPVDDEKLAELAEIAKTKETAGEGLAFLAQEIAKLS